VRALTDVSFGVKRGEVFSIIGPNGAGKTSMVNCVSGRYRPTEGRIRFEGPGHHAAADAQARRHRHRPHLPEPRAVRPHDGAREHHGRAPPPAAEGLPARDAVVGRGARREEIAHRREVEEIIDFLEIQHVRKAVAGQLSYGLRKRVELARAMALKPKLILLDEPMAGMNLEEKEDMARFIIDLNEEWGMTVLMIEHDMGVVMDISHRVVVLDFGRKIAEGRPEEVMADPHVRRAYLGEADEVVQEPAEALEPTAP
jgi:branched-chain amino acid transport system ATP-binding protein